MFLIGDFVLILEKNPYTILGQFWIFAKNLTKITFLDPKIIENFV